MAELITDYPTERDALLCVMSGDGSSKGWRVELLVEKLSSKVEEKLLLCSSCNGLLRDACLCKGTLMCHVCIPVDTASQPVEMNREIVNEKMIYCPLKWRGCGWSDRVSAAVHHLEDCLYLPVACPLGCVSLEGERKGEVVKVERIHISRHVKDSCPLRILVCEFCEGEVKANEMNPHLEDCGEFPLPCPNGCSREGEEGMRELKRNDIPVHLDNHCPLQRVQCPFWDHGCREEMKRRHTDTHEGEFLHIHFKLSTKVLTYRIAVLEKQNSDKDLQIASLTETLFTYTQLPTGRLEWNVKGVKEKIQNKEMTFSDPFYVGLYKCQSCITWEYMKTGYVGVYICIMKGDFDAKLHWPIRYRDTFVLTNQIDSKDSLVKFGEIPKESLEKFPQCIKRPTEYRNEGLGRDSFISTTDILKEKYCKQDSITLHISVELLPPL